MCHCGEKHHQIELCKAPGETDQSCSTRIGVDVGRIVREFEQTSCFIDPGAISIRKVRWGNVDALATLASRRKAGSPMNRFQQVRLTSTDVVQQQASVPIERKLYKYNAPGDAGR